MGRLREELTDAAVPSLLRCLRLHQSSLLAMEVHRADDGLSREAVDALRRGLKVDTVRIREFVTEPGVPLAIEC